MLNTRRHQRHFYYLVFPVAVSASVVAMLISMEYVAIVWLRPDSFGDPFGSVVVDFVISDNGTIGAFVVADDGDASSHKGPRYRVGFIDMRHGKLRGELLTLASRPKRLLPRDGPSNFLIGGFDGSIVSADCRFSTVEPICFGTPNNCVLASLHRAKNRTTIICFETASIKARQEKTGELIWERRAENIADVAINDSGKWLYCGMFTGEVLQIDAGTGQLERVCVQHNGEVLRLTVSPCGEYLASVVSHGHLVMTRLSDGKTVWTSYAFTTSKPTFTGDGTRLVVVEQRVGAPNRLVAIDACSGARLFDVGEHNRAVGVRCTADGNLYSWGSDGCIKAWDLNGRQQRWLSRPVIKRDQRQIVLAAIEVPAS
ncbi:MAG: hypothetical protein ABGX22_05790 [Pirellulaceae bacterium]